MSYIYRYDFNAHGGNVEVAIFDPENGRARFGYEARVTLFERVSYETDAVLNMLVEIGMGSFTVGIEDAKLRAAVYAKAIEIAERAQNIINVTVGTPIFNAAALMLPPENTEVAA